MNFVLLFKIYKEKELKSIIKCNIYSESKYVIKLTLNLSVRLVIYVNLGAKLNFKKIDIFLICKGNKT